MKILFKRPTLESDAHKIFSYENYFTAINGHCQSIGLPLYSNEKMQKLYEVYFDILDNANKQPITIDSIDIDAKDYDTTIKELTELHKTIEVIKIFND